MIHEKQNRRAERKLPPGIRSRTVSCFFWCAETKSVNPGGGESDSVMKPLTGQIRRILTDKNGKTVHDPGVLMRIVKRSVQTGGDCVNIYHTVLDKCPANAFPAPG